MYRNIQKQKVLTQLKRSNTCISVSTEAPQTHSNVSGPDNVVHLMTQ